MASRILFGRNDYWVYRCDISLVAPLSRFTPPRLDGSWCKDCFSQTIVDIAGLFLHGNVRLIWGDRENLEKKKVLEKYWKIY